MSNLNTITTPKLLFHDFETKSEENLLDAGASRYSRHETTKTLMCAYAFDYDKPKQWIPEQGEEMPAELEDRLLDERIHKCAFNKSFEDSIWQNVHAIHIPNAQWRDTMILALACGLPKNLDTLCGVLGLSHFEKKIDGRKLIQKFCMPGKNGWVHWHEEEELWAQMLQYNKRDVVAEQVIHRTLSNFDLPDSEWQMWQIDQKINQKGIPIDMVMAKKASLFHKKVKRWMLEQIFNVTGGIDPKSPEKILSWLDKNGHALDNLCSGSISRYLTHMERSGVSKDDDCYRVLEMYKQTCRRSLTKFGDMVALADEDNRVRNAYQFMGAGTGRWTAYGIQPQNMAGHSEGINKIIWDKTASGHKIVKASQPTMVAKVIKHADFATFTECYPRPIDALCSAVRPAIKAPDGHVLLVADLKFIEVLVLGFVTDEEKILSPIREGKDPYLSFGIDLFNAPYKTLLEEYKAGDSSKRDQAKPGMLGCGFSMGAGTKFKNKKTGAMEATGLIGFAQNMGIDLSAEQSKNIELTYRKTFSNVVGGWDLLEAAAKRCVNTLQPVKCGHVTFDMKGSFLRIKLPSGRHLYYYQPKVGLAESKWGSLRKSLTYAKEWYKPDNRVRTHGGKLMQNIVSGIARDLFANGMRLADERGLDIIMHCADELVAQSPKSKADEQMTILKQSMCEKPNWWGDIEISVDGYITDRFLKG